MSKKQLLSDIVCADQLGIERVFGEVAWEKFLELQPDDEIVVIGNGPVCSFQAQFTRCLNNRRVILVLGDVVS